MMEVRKSGFLRTIPLILIVMLFCPLARGKTIYVDDNGQMDFDNIQAGIDAADDGDTVLVAPGEYIITEPITFRGKAITVKSETGRDETTIRIGTPTDTNRGSGVIFENNETTASVLEGFSITGGNGSWVSSASTYAGGGIYFDASSGTVRNCAIIKNEAGTGGGVFCAYPCSSRMFNCIIAENSAESGGGLAVWSGSSLTLMDCIIRGNSATGSTDGSGGGVGCWINSRLSLTNCIVTGNSAAVTGGGIHTWQQSSSTVNNCVIALNTALGLGGGGMGCCPAGSAAVTNSIFWENTAPKGYEILVRSEATFSISYSDVADGQPGLTVEGGKLNWGSGNIDADPCFADPNNDDYHLKSQAGRWDPNDQVWVRDELTSPCINAGDPNSDWTAELWPHSERINMGAYGGTREASMSTKPESMLLPRVAYVYGSDVEATESYRSLLMSYGCPTTLMGVDDVTTAALDSYDLIIVANDTQYETTWSDPNTVAAIEDSGRPVVGLGDGGYDFFGLLGLSIGNPYGGHGSKHSIEVIDPNGSVFNTPYSIEIPQDHVLRLYTETHHVGIYLWPTIPETVTVLGREVDDVGYHPLVVEQDRYLLWGFTESPLKMTEEGKRLFINVVIRASNKALSS